MSTHCRIGILVDDNKVLSVYCHFDGYPQYMGKVLRMKFRSENDVMKLLSQGDLISVDPDGGIESFYDKRGEDWDTVKPKIWNMVEFNQAEPYAYLFIPEHNIWVAYTRMDDYLVNNEVRAFNKGNRVQVPAKMKVVT